MTRSEGHDTIPDKDTAARMCAVAWYKGASARRSCVGVDVAPSEGHDTRSDINTAAGPVAAGIVASGDVEPDHLHDAQRARVDVQHTARTRGARLCIQHDRACHRRLEDDAPGDAELGAQVVCAGGKDNVADGGVGKCTGQAGNGAHRRLQLTPVAWHRVQPGSVAGLGAREHAVQCKESEGNMKPMLLSRPMPSAKGLGESMAPCHERSHQHAPPKYKLPWIEYAAAVQNMSRRHQASARAQSGGDEDDS